MFPLKCITEHHGSLQGWCLDSWYCHRMPSTLLVEQMLDHIVSHPHSAMRILCHSCSAYTLLYVIPLFQTSTITARSISLPYSSSSVHTFVARSWLQPWVENRRTKFRWSRTARFWRSRQNGDSNVEHGKQSNRGFGRGSRGVLIAKAIHISFCTLISCLQILMSIYPHISPCAILRRSKYQVCWQHRICLSMHRITWNRKGITQLASITTKGCRTHRIKIFTGCSG